MNKVSVILGVLVVVLPMAVFAEVETFRMESIYPSKMGRVTVSGDAYLATDTNGKVGIGTNKPQGKLDVAEWTNPVSNSCPQGTAWIDLNANGNTENGECWMGMLFDEGTLGIGTVNPNLLYKLDVEGDIKTNGITSQSVTTGTVNADKLIVGQVTITGGSPQAGKVLTSSDSSGSVSWQTVSSPSCSLKCVYIYGIGIHYNPATKVITTLGSCSSGYTLTGIYRMPSYVTNPYDEWQICCKIECE